LDVTMKFVVNPLAVCTLMATALPGIAAAQTLDLDAQTAVETKLQSGGQAGQGSAAAQVAPEAAAAAQAAVGAQTAAQPVAEGPRQRTQRAVPGFVLRDIRFTGRSQYLSDQMLEAAEARLLGARLDARGVSAFGGILTQLYLDQGITTAQAVVRDVNVARGVVTIELLEARLGRVTYQSNILSDAFLKYRLNIPEGALADNRLIDERLQDLQATDGIAAGVGYAPGANFGETDLTVTVPDLPRHATTVTLDNYGAPSAGETQLTLSHTINSITGWNDPLTLGYTHRQGSRALSLGYARGISRGGARLSFGLSGSQTNTLGALSVAGMRRDASVGLTLPVMRDAEARVNLGLSVAGFTEASNFLGVRILDQQGQELGASVSTFHRGDQWTLSSSFGLTAGQFDNGVTGVRGNRYSFASLSASYARNILPDVFASAQVNMQQSLSGALPASRQYTTTAANAVRGYPSGASTGDEGYFARFQVEKSTPYAIAGPSFGLRPFTFFDLGEARDSTNAALGQARSVGLGASFTAVGSVVGDIYVARPLETGLIGLANPSTQPVIGGSISAKF
jgi:hemolysin activation/secretion protein